MALPIIAVVRGGYTRESVISMQSAARIMAAIDRKRFAPCFVTITKDSWSAETPEEHALPFDRGNFSVDRGQGPERINGAFIAIHGSPGEDGLLQGYLDLLGVPYQTGKVPAMALTMGKYGTTAMLRQLGFDVAPSVFLIESMPDAASRAASLGFPCFVKPDRSGSSLGMSKVKTPAALDEALRLAFEECPAVMVEGAVTGRELTCGVIDLEGHPKALPLCEIRHDREFFDYEAKYHSKETQEIVPAPIPDEVAKAVQKRSEAIYAMLGCRGMVRVDHLWTGERIVTIEVNTTPGFSSASIFPKMVEASGIGVERLVNGLIQRMLGEAA